MEEDFGYMDMMENLRKSKIYFYSRLYYVEPFISQIINSMELRNIQKGK